MGNEGKKEQGVEWRRGRRRRWRRRRQKATLLSFLCLISDRLSTSLSSLERKLAGLTNREADERNRRHPDGRRVLFKGRESFCALHKAYRKHSLTLSVSPTRHSKRRSYPHTTTLAIRQTTPPRPNLHSKPTGGRTEGLTCSGWVGSWVGP